MKEDESSARVAAMLRNWMGLDLEGRERVSKQNPKLAVALEKMEVMLKNRRLNGVGAKSLSTSSQKNEEHPMFHEGQEVTARKSKIGMLKQSCPFCDGDIDRSNRICTRCGVGFPMSPDSHRNDRKVSKLNSDDAGPWQANAIRNLEE
jgi:ribosomal protein S27AE